MASEKEQFVTKQYVPVGEPIASNDHTVVFKVKCFAQPGTPDGILKMYRHKNVSGLYTRLAQLDYSEWPHIYDVKHFDGNTLVVEEFLQGNTLAELLADNRAKGITFSEPEASRIMDRLCDCVHQLMQAYPPIIHYNLKPSNIFVTNTGAIKLLDFVPGVTKKKHPLHNILNILGAIFHQMLTGKTLKNGKCTYNGRYETVIRRCIEKIPEKQYQDITELKDDIEYASSHEPESSTGGIAKIPYVLTYPFQGTILAFEWLLLSFFLQKENTSTMCLFTLIFAIHLFVFGLRRHTFMKENNVHLSTARKAYPVLILILVFACLSLVLSFLV